MAQKACRRFPCAGSESLHNRVQGTTSRCEILLKVLSKVRFFLLAKTASTEALAQIHPIATAKARNPDSRLSARHEAGAWVTYFLCLVGSISLYDWPFFGVGGRGAAPRSRDLGTGRCVLVLTRLRCRSPRLQRFAHENNLLLENEQYCTIGNDHRASDRGLTAPRSFGRHLHLTTVRGLLVGRFIAPVTGAILRQSHLLNVSRYYI